jgi:hypothetical protein
VCGHLNVCGQLEGPGRAAAGCPGTAELGKPEGWPGQPRWRCAGCRAIGIGATSYAHGGLRDGRRRSCLTTKAARQAEILASSSGARSTSPRPPDRLDAVQARWRRHHCRDRSRQSWHGHAAIRFSRAARDTDVACRSKTSSSTRTPMRRRSASSAPRISASSCSIPAETIRWRSTRSVPSG